MAKLLWVKGPHTTDSERAVQIQWSMGNTCNFSCDYCPSILHDGSKPWMSTERYLQVVDKISNHYRSKNRFMHWELLGGEVTTIPDFEKIIERIVHIALVLQYIQMVAELHVGGKKQEIILQE